MAQELSLIEKAQAKGITTKKIIKGFAIVMGVSLIIFMTFFDAILDPKKLDLATWLTNSLTMLAIIVFGIVMGESIGEDAQKEKVNGMYQNASADYLIVRESIRQIDAFFSQWWLLHKQKRLFEKKIDFLVNNQFDTRVATTIVKYIEKEDIVVGKLIFDEKKPTEKIYIKEIKGKQFKFKKIYADQKDIVLSIYKITLDTFGDDYYLSLYDDGIENTNDAEKGKKIAERIKQVKIWRKVIKIASALVISAVWGMLTIREFSGGGDEDSAMKTAWINLISRITSLITAFASGFSTSVINVKNLSYAIENKSEILRSYKQDYDNKVFIPETYEQMVEREYLEQIQVEEENKKCDNNNVGGNENPLLT